MSFYGGIKGKDFEIKTVYSSKAAMDAAITNKELDVNDYVMISTLNYGEEITENSTTDNATLWKIILNNNELEPQFITKLAPSGVFSLGEVIMLFDPSTEETLIEDIQNEIRRLEIEESDFDIFPVSAPYGSYWYFTSSKQTLKIQVTQPIIIEGNTQPSPNTVYSSDYLAKSYTAPFARALVGGGQTINFNEIFTDNVVKISAGGTGAKTADAARAALGAQANLGFTPVQEGTGVGQKGNRVKIGWSGTGLKATVDNTDLGTILTTLPSSDGVLPIAKGGTGAATVEQARRALGAYGAFDVIAEVGTVVTVDQDISINDPKWLESPGRIPEDSALGQKKIALKGNKSHIVDQIVNYGISKTNFSSKDKFASFYIYNEKGDKSYVFIQNDLYLGLSTILCLIDPITGHLLHKYTGLVQQRKTHGDIEYVFQRGTIGYSTKKNTLVYVLVYSPANSNNGTMARLSYGTLTIKDDKIVNNVLVDMFGTSYQGSQIDQYQFGVFDEIVRLTSNNNGYRYNGTGFTDLTNNTAIVPDSHTAYENEGTTYMHRRVTENYITYWKLYKYTQGTGFNLQKTVTDPTNPSISDFLDINILKGHILARVSPASSSTENIDLFFDMSGSNWKTSNASYTKITGGVLIAEPEEVLEAVKLLQAKKQGQIKILNGNNWSQATYSPDTPSTLTWSSFSGAKISSYVRNPWNSKEIVLVSDDFIAFIGFATPEVQGTGIKTYVKINN